DIVGAVCNRTYFFTSASYELNLSECTSQVDGIHGQLFGPLENIFRGNVHGWLAIIAKVGAGGIDEPRDNETAEVQHQVVRHPHDRHVAVPSPGSAEKTDQFVIPG